MFNRSVVKAALFRLPPQPLKKNSSIYPNTDILCYPFSMSHLVVSDSRPKVINISAAVRPVSGAVEVG